MAHRVRDKIEFMCHYWSAEMSSETNMFTRAKSGSNRPFYSTVYPHCNSTHAKSESKARVDSCLSAQRDYRLCDLARLVFFAFSEQ